MTPAEFTRPREFPPMEDIHDTARERCFRIAPVAIAYGRGPRKFVKEYRFSDRLLKELWRLGRAKVPVRAMISTHGALHPLSLSALNVYLETAYARQSLNHLRCYMHKYVWRDLQETVGFRWVR